MFLMLRNKGVSDAKAFTLLGVSTSRNSTNSSTIGTFGSGAMHAISTFLRNNINPVYYTGHLKMEYFSEPILVNGEQFNQLMVKYSGKDHDGTNRSGTADLQSVLEWGAGDWTKLAMGFREFVANAIDGSIASGGTYKDVEIEVKDAPRAKAGHTAVFLPLNEQVQELWKNLNQLFLHFSRPHLLGQKILPKQLDDGFVRIYKKGVLVGTEKGNSVFDYNLGNELTLDESRNANPWDTRYAVAKALSSAEPKYIAQILSAQLDGKEVWEDKLDTDYLYATYDCEEVKKVKAEAFKTAFKAIVGDTGIVTTGTKHIAEVIEKKGFRPIKVSPTWFAALTKYGIPSESDVLNGLEKEGIPESPATKDMLDAVDEVWELLKSHNLLNGKEKPPVKAFSPIMDAGSQIRGMYKSGIVYLHTDLVASPLMLKVALEEVVHHLTEATDMSRDMQDFLFRLIVKMWQKDSMSLAA